MCTSCCLQNTGIGMLRSKIRGAYQIEGSVCEGIKYFFWKKWKKLNNLYFLKDCICGICCPCCTACQIYRNILFLINLF